jgi:S1-C subfamily serine protease
VQGVRYPGNAASAGVGQGDVVLSADGKPVKTLKEIREIYDSVMADETREKKVLLELDRNRQRRWIVLDYTKDYKKEE